MWSSDTSFLYFCSHPILVKLIELNFYKDHVVADSRFQGSMLTSSFICPEMLPSGVTCSEKYGMSDFWRPIKAEHGTGFRNLYFHHITEINFLFFMKTVLHPPQEASSVRAIAPIHLPLGPKILG